jgi:hypothetical protein
MNFNYIDKIGSMSPDKQLHFYELLAHNLTISIRGIWSEPDLGDSEKLDRIYLINEILHRVTSKVYTLRLKLHEWTELDSWEMIESYMAHKREIEKDVMAAINFSYKSAIREETEETGTQNDA